MKSCATCGSRLDNIICSASPEVLQILDKSKVVCQFKTGQYIFYAGNDPLGIFSISKGLIKLEVTSSHGAPHTLRMVGPPGNLGYRALFAHEPYHASAIAVEDSELCFIPKATIMAVAKEFPAIAMRFLEYISKDLRVAEAKWMDQMDKGAPERIAEALLFLQTHFTHQPWTRREIAQWAGTTPETVMRALAQFEREGLIDQSDGRQILVLHPEKLKNRAHS